ncbi:transposase [Ottowia testudinis]|uniref:Transposase n=1 Tax=Ottowia testudinis TaxID=2816950 RepID=A0A975CI81_9BURK|nr:transposase [Ottowia testudinis]
MRLIRHGQEQEQGNQQALFKRIQPLLTAVKPSAKGGRPRLSDERALNGILFVLRTGTPWTHLPKELGFGCGMTCWRRMRNWQAAGVWHRLHLALLAELRGAGKLDFGRASIDASVASPRRVRTPAPTRAAGASLAAGATSLQTAGALS